MLIAINAKPKYADLKIIDLIKHSFTNSYVLSSRSERRHKVPGGAKRNPGMDRKTKRARVCERRTPVAYLFIAHLNPTCSTAFSGEWLSRYATRRLTGDPPKLPPRNARRVLT